MVSQWENGQTVEVKVTNTGEESIVNWAFLYDAEGTISSIWNAAVVDNKDTKYVIKNDSWNYEIASGQSVNFGYTLTDDDFAAPHDFSLCSGRMNISDGYKVDVNVKSTWDTGVEGELVITNTSDRPLEAWTLDFDTNFTVNNVWDGQLLESGDNHYRIACASWTNPIPVNGSAKIGFTGTKDIGIEPGVNSFALTCVGLDYTFETAAGGSMELIADTDEILAEVSSKTVYFYVFTEEEIPAVSLVDTQTNQVVATLVDDGNYASSGDDMMGDGVYSAKYTLNTNVPEDTVYSYRAVADDKMTSNEISIAVYLPFTEQELDDMEYVDNAILKVLRDNPTPDYLKNIPSEFVQNGYVEDYSNVFEKRYSELIATLEALLVEGKLESYHYDEAGHAFVCRYKSGGEFFIDVDDKLESADMEEPVVMPAIMGLYDEYNVLILNMFEDDTFRTPYYEELVRTWRAAGLNVVYDDYVTVLDLKTELQNKDFITFSGHGTVRDGCSYLTLRDDKVTRMKDRAYTLDIKTERIKGEFGSKEEPYYGVTDSFFTYYYGRGGLSGSFIFSEACEFMGSIDKKGFDDTFASALVNDCQAEAVVGFYNTVNAVYSRNMMTHYFERLLMGQTAEEAFTYAREMCGYDDFSYQIPTFLEYLTGKGFPEETIVRSVPYLTGNGSAVFMRRFQNGDWESIAQFFHAKPMK